LNSNETKLSDHCDDSKATVVIGGSYSWPPLRAIIPDLHILYDTYKDKFNFVFIYILEAHAQDEWPIRSSRDTTHHNPVLYNQTHTKEDRIRVATEFVRDYDFKIQVVVDDEKNSFERTYASWPLRIFIINNHKMDYISHPEPKMLELTKLKQYLKNKK